MEPMNLDTNYALFSNNEENTFVKDSFADGMIVKAKPSDAFIEFVSNLVELSGVDTINLDTLHQTVLYAKKQYSPKLIEFVEKLGKNAKYSIMSPYLNIFENQKNEVILAIGFICPALQQLNLQLQKDFGVTHSFPELKLHMTLNYNYDETKGDRKRRLDTLSRLIQNTPSWKSPEFYLHKLTVAPIQNDYDDEIQTVFLDV